MTMMRGTLSRLHILKMSAAGGALGAFSPIRAVLGQTALRRAQDQLLGPSYPVMSVPNQRGESTRGGVRVGRAKGQVLNVMGRVLNRAGEPVRGAKVEIWQANAAGRYAHPDDPNPAPLDPNFEGFGVVITDAEGHYRFKTIKPAGYPTGPTSMRPAHIHFEVVARHDELITQMYFEGDPYNDKDRFLQSASRPEALIVRLRPAKQELEPDSMTAVFDIVVRG